MAFTSQSLPLWHSVLLLSQLVKRSTKGLTLVELLVTLAVAIVLLGVGIPAFQALQANSRAAALANQVVSALTLARMEALGRGQPTALCPRGGDDSDGVPTCGDSADWVNGWLVFVDAGPNPGALDSAADGEGEAAILRLFAPPGGRPTIALQERTVELKNNSQATKTEAVDVLRFLSNGWRVLPTGLYAEAAFTLKTTGASSGQGRCVNVNQSGRVSVTRLAEGGSCL